MNQKGQVILVLMLVMSVGLAIGLSVVQKSLVDVSTSSKIEQSSKAFSAAEAGVEKALKGDTSLQTFTDTNSSITSIDAPDAVAQNIVEVPFLAKEEVANVWLADPKASLPSCSSPSICYIQSSLDVYWGSSSSPVLEVTLVYYDSSKFVSRNWYFHPTSSSGNFTQANCSGGFNLNDKSYQCKETLSSLPSSGQMLLRAKFLDIGDRQPFAVKGSGSYTFPAQTRDIVSIGSSGETQRRVRLQQFFNVVPAYFDYAIFSAGEINK